jgi:hypothetical protein
MKSNFSIFRWTMMVLPVMAVLFSACNVDVKKTADGKGKNVQIDTPVAHLHVSENADASETGLPVYPGAKVFNEDDDQNHQNANVNIGTSFFGLKVVVVKYESDDSVDKVKEYYRRQLEKYGNFLECKANTVAINPGFGDDSKSDALVCEQNSGDNLELKAGSKRNQHVVSIEPQGKGCKFTLVYVQMHGKDTTI